MIDCNLTRLGIIVDEKAASFTDAKAIDPARGIKRKAA